MRLKGTLGPLPILKNNLYHHKSYLRFERSFRMFRQMLQRGFEFRTLNEVEVLLTCIDEHQEGSLGGERGRRKRERTGRHQIHSTITIGLKGNTVTSVCFVWNITQSHGCFGSTVVGLHLHGDFQSLLGGLRPLFSFCNYHSPNSSSRFHPRTSRCF